MGALPTLATNIKFMEEKVITVLIANNMRQLITKANDLKIPKEDIVGIFPYEKQIYLVYYL